MCYIFITYQGQKYAIHESDPVLHYLDSLKPFRLMPEYTAEERARRREENNERIEKLIDESWNVEKERRKAERPNPKWSKKAREAFLRTHPPPKYSEKNKEDWDKKFRQKFREQVEAENPPLTIDDFKNPLENKVCQRVILEAFKAGVDETVLDMFVRRLVSLRSSSEEAAEAFFSYFMTEPLLLKEFALVAFPKKGSSVPAIEVHQPWMQELMQHRLFSPRQTGKGELGAFALFGGELHLLSTEKRGDFVVKDGTEECNVEVKSTETRKRQIRLGAEHTWADSITYKLISSTPLGESSIMKEISRTTVEKNTEEIKKAFGSVQQFIQSIESDMRKVLAEYDRMFVYIEDEHVFEEVRPEDTYFYGVSSEGRWKFTLVPNTLFEGL